MLNFRNKTTINKRNSLLGVGVKKYFLIFLFSLFVSFPLFGLANDAPVPVFKLEHSPPCLLQSALKGGCPDINTIPGYISNLYRFAVGISGIVAVGMIAIGAIYISLSGSVDKKGEGKDMITSALLGLALLLGSWLILNTINPNLVENMKIPEATDLGKLPPCSTIPEKDQNPGINCEPEEIISWQKTCKTSIKYDKRINEFGKTLSECHGKITEGGYTNWYHPYVKFASNGSFIEIMCIKYAARNNSDASSTYTMIPFPKGGETYKPC